MAYGRETPFGQRRAVGHCVRCASRLIYTEASVEYHAEVILDRRCPECEYRESVVVSALDAAARYRQDTRIMAGMIALADSLRDDDPTGAPGPRVRA